MQNDEMKVVKQMNNCKFCNGEVIEPGSVGDGFQNMSMMIDRLQYAFGFEAKSQTFGYCKNGIQLQNGNRLCWDNSAREYALLDVEIRYCPFCGRELEYKS